MSEEELRELKEIRDCAEAICGGDYEIGWLVTDLNDFIWKTEKQLKRNKEKQELEEHGFEPISKEDKDDRLNDVILLI